LSRAATGLRSSPSARRRASLIRDGRRSLPEAEDSKEDFEKPFRKVAKEKPEKVKR
jgi:hypothetical protein